MRDYLSEFEREFELELESVAAETQNESSREIPSHAELEAEFESEARLLAEMEAAQAYETPDFRSETRYEHTENRELEFEDRLYQTLNSSLSHEQNMEMEVHQLLNEMEQEYFFGKLKKLASSGLLKKLAMLHPGGMAMKLASMVPLNKVRGLLSNKLLQTAASFIPGAGPLISKGMGIATNLLNKVPQSPKIPREQVQELVQLSKNAYENLAHEVANAQHEVDLQNAPKNALLQAAQQVQTHPKKTKRQKRTIPMNANAVVVVYQDRVVIWE